MDGVDLELTAPLETLYPRMRYATNRGGWRDRVKPKHRRGTARYLTDMELARWREWLSGEPSPFAGSARCGNVRGIV